MAYWQILLVMILLKVPGRYAISSDVTDQATLALQALKDRLHRGSFHGVASLASMTMSDFKRQTNPPLSSIERNRIETDEEQPKGGFFHCLESRKADFNRIDLPLIEAPLIQCGSKALLGESLTIFSIGNQSETKEEGRSNDKSWLETFEEFTKTHGIRIPFGSGFGMRMSRNTQDPDYIDLSLELDKSLYFNGNEDEFNDDDDTTLEELEAGRSGNEKQGKRKRRKGFIKKMIPLLTIPVLIQAAVVPMFLKMLSMMVFKAMLLGKLALFLVGFNNLRFRINQTQEEVFHQNMAYNHYGYDGTPEYGSYVNYGGKRRRRRR